MIECTKLKWIIREHLFVQYRNKPEWSGLLIQLIIKSFVKATLKKFVNQDIEMIKLLSGLSVVLERSLS